MRGLCFSLYCLIAQILKAIVLGQISWGNITEILSQCRHLADSKFPEEFEWLERSKFYDFHIMHRERLHKLLLHCFVSILKVILSQSLTSLGIFLGGGEKILLSVVVRRCQKVHLACWFQRGLQIFKSCASCSNKCFYQGRKLPSRALSCKLHEFTAA